MRIQRVSYPYYAGSKLMPALPGKIGTILSHSNNTLHIKLDDSNVECDDLYWNWAPLDEEAKKYIAEVERTAIPSTSSYND